MTESLLVDHVVEGLPEGPAVVLSNSLGSSRAMWDPQMPGLSRRFRVIRYDHRGHGASPVPPGPYRIADVGADIVTLLDHLAIERAHLCGLSIGGMACMWVAANAPERVDRMVLCSTSANLGPPEDWAKRAAIVREHGTAAVADLVVARWFTPGFAERHPDVVGGFRDMIAATPAEGYAGCCGAIERMDLAPELPEVRAATLVIAAAQDPSTPPDHARRIAALIPRARLELVQDAAHLVNVEQPDRVTRLIVDHLTGTERA